MRRFPDIKIKMWSVCPLPVLRCWEASQCTVQCLKKALKMITVSCTTFHYTQNSVTEQTMTSGGITKLNIPIGKRQLSPPLLLPFSFLPFPSLLSFRVLKGFSFLYPRLALNMRCQDDSEFLTLLPPQPECWLTGGHCHAPLMRC